MESADVKTTDVKIANVRTADVRTAVVNTADVRTADVDAQKEAAVECAAIVDDLKVAVNIPIEINPVGESDGGTETYVLASVEVHKTHVDKDRSEAINEVDEKGVDKVDEEGVDQVDDEGVDQVDGPPSLLVWNGQEWTRYRIRECYFTFQKL